MKIFGYVVIALLVTGVLVFAYIATPAYFPCVAYKTEYFKTRAFGDKVEAFRIKYGHLPGANDANQPVVVELDPGNRFSYLPATHEYWLLTYVKYDSDAKEFKPQDFGAAFDGPWVKYNASAKSVSCGHR